MADWIGNYEFVSVIGVLPRLTRTFTEITLPGEDGNSYREMGVRSEQAVLRCVVDPANDAQADNLIEGIKNFLTGTLVAVQQYNRTQNGVYYVLNVREAVPREIFSVSSGGIFEGDEKIELDVTLIRVT